MGKTAIQSISRLITTALLPLIFSTPSAWAYNAKNCSEKIIYPKPITKDNFSNAMAMTTIGSSSSTTSYVSSTGPCKAFGSLEKQREFYIASNFVEIKKQAAQGGGEYVDALSSYYGCKGDSRALPKALKSHYAEIFNDKSDLQLASSVDESVKKSLIAEGFAARFEFVSEN